MRKRWPQDGAQPEGEIAFHAARVRLWKSMLEDFELSWLKDVPASTASRIVDATLRKMKETRAKEESWRMFFGERGGSMKEEAERGHALA